MLPQALALADLPNQAALADALRELADRRYRADGQTLIAGRVGQVSSTLQGALRRALTQTTWASASSRMGFDAGTHRRADDLDDRLRACLVPQLFWAEDYQRQLAELFDFDYFTHWFGRRFCSLLLARMLTSLDWNDAVRYLDFPARLINDGYHKTFTRLNANGRLDELAGRVKRIANQHAQDRLIDYKQRRARLADWDGIDIETWYLLQPRPRPIDPRRRRNMPVRRAHASVWLWCQLTSGHERAAPIKLPTDNLAHHTYFIRDVLPPLRERLLILSEPLLATPADTRSTLPNRLAAALHERGNLAERYFPDSIDPLITSRVLAHTSAHTGVDIPSLTTASSVPSRTGTRPRQPTPTAPHHERMHDLARAIKAHSATLLASAQGPNMARHASIAVCREHPDLTSRQIATIHNVNHAQPTLARATIDRRRRNDPDFHRRYRQPLNHAQELQRQAGYTNANLKRGLTSKPATTDGAATGTGI
ncbi:MAG: hypothetical protein WBP81_12240 [Solirubrobacteraceae bacterium]